MLYAMYHWLGINLEPVATGFEAFFELLVALVIYFEFEGSRLNHFLEDIDSEKSAQGRWKIYKAYCGLSLEQNQPLNLAFRTELESGNDEKLVNDCHDQIRLFSRIGARRPVFWPFKTEVENWHVVVLLWEILGPYVEERRSEAGPSYARPFLKYASKSAKRMLKQKRNSWTIRDPDLKRKKNIEITRERLRRMRNELKASLKRR